MAKRKIEKIIIQNDEIKTDPPYDENGQSDIEGSIEVVQPEGT